MADTLEPTNEQQPGSTVASISNTIKQNECKLIMNSAHEAAFQRRSHDWQSVQFVKLAGKG